MWGIRLDEMRTIRENSEQVYAQALVKKICVACPICVRTLYIFYAAREKQDWLESDHAEQ